MSRVTAKTVEEANRKLERAFGDLTMLAVKYKGTDEPANYLTSTAALLAAAREYTRALVRTQKLRIK